MTGPHTTAHIPDESVQAMPERIYAMHREDTKHCIVAFEEFSADHIEYVRADVAAAHLSAPCAVEVKKLEWRQGTAETSFGDYDIYRDEDEAMADYPVCVSNPEGIIGHFQTEGEALTAAQADFERRTLSSVVTKPVDVATLREEGFQDAVKQAASVADDYIQYDVVKSIRALSAEPVDVAAVREQEAGK